MIGVASGGTARLESWILITLLSLLGLFLFSQREQLFSFCRILKYISNLNMFMYMWGTGIRECSFEK